MSEVNILMIDGGFLPLQSVNHLTMMQKHMYPNMLVINKTWGMNSNRNSMYLPKYKAFHPA